jgi:hypothetical protein
MNRLSRRTPTDDYGYHGWYTERYGEEAPFDEGGDDAWTEIASTMEGCLETNTEGTLRVEDDDIDGTKSSAERYDAREGPRMIRGERSMIDLIEWN